MARNGSGTYSLPSAYNPVVTNTPITIAWANNTLTDIATALTQSIATTGVSTVTANIPFAGFKITGLGAGTTNGDAVRYEQLTLKADLAGATFTGVVNEVKGADIVCAATINLTTATGNIVHVTGNTGPVTAITLGSGFERTVVFDSTPTLTHNATTLILPTGANIVAAAGDTAVFRGDGSGNTRCISYQRATGSPLGPSSGFPYIHVREEQASGTQGGASVAGTQVRTLNTVVTNTITGASLSTNLITLPAGTFQILARVPSYGNINGCKGSLYNNTDAATIIVGSSINMGTAGVAGDSWIEGQFTLAASKAVKINHYTASVGATNGLGAAASSGQVEVYTEVQIWKVA